MLLGNRYYDPSVGRFISPDPSGDGDNWYAYCNNNPLSNVDPEGLDTLTVTTTTTTTTWLQGASGVVPGSVQTTVTTSSYSIDVPDGQNIDKNIADARSFNNAVPFGGFYGSLAKASMTGNKAEYLASQTAHKNRGAQIGDYKDYKDTVGLPNTNPLKHQRILGGNFNYGAMGEALGYNLKTLLDMGQIIHVKDTLLFGGPLALYFNPTHPADEQQAISDGFYYAQGKR